MKNLKDVQPMSVTRWYLVLVLVKIPDSHGMRKIQISSDFLAGNILRIYIVSLGSVSKKTNTQDRQMLLMPFCVLKYVIATIWIQITRP